jgi:hypothetical protein
MGSNSMFLSLLIFGLLLGSCAKDSPVPTPVSKQKFESSFEFISDFDGFYITPQGEKGTTFHELSDSIVHSGKFAHHAWVDGANPPSSATVNNNHRGYPTVQFQNTKNGSFQTPCYITLWVWVDMDLQPSSTGGEDDWLSFATFTDDETDLWRNTVLVNLSHDGFVHLMHVPTQGKQEYTYQNTSLVFPQKEWVELKIYLDFRENGYAKVWQNGTLVSHAKVSKGTNKLAQAHFGLYCPPQMTSGHVYNDDLQIIEVDTE